MDLHKNARSCPASRAVLVERVMALGWTVKGAAEAQGLSERAAYRWLARYRQEGPAGLMDRSSRPKRVARERRAPAEGGAVCRRGRRVRSGGRGRLEQLRHRRRVVPHARGVHLPPRRARRPQPGAPAPGQSGCRAPAPGPGAGGHACRLWPLLRNVSAGEARDHRGVHGALAWLGGLSRPPPGPRREPCRWRAPAVPSLHLALLAPVRGPGARKQDPLRLQRGLGTGLGARCAGRGEDRLATDHAYARRCRLLRGARPRGN